jgi:menaquinone-specific isochorismate synthase
VTARRAAVDRLVAKTTELDPAEPVDLIAFAGDHGFLFEQEGHGLAGRGEAVRVRADQAAAALAAIDGEGAVALGALPFDDPSAGSMVIPEVVVRRFPDGRQTHTSFWVPDLTPWREIGDPKAEGVLPDSFTLTSPRSHDEFRAMVGEAVEAIRRGELGKVVVAREVLVEANRIIVVSDVLERLRALYPACVVFSVDGFVGASPELLVERNGTAVRSHPLAGTYPRSGDPHADEVLAAQLLASVKDQREHRFVIDDICAALRPLCTDLAVPGGPEIMQLRNVLHLGTEIAGTLREPAPSALDLALQLHPTPAVGGTPTNDALAWLRENEGFERGRYAGPVGWVDANGDGLFAVGIRSAEIDGRRARLFAGVGIVEGSDTKRELVETQLKLQALLAAVVRP